MVISTITTTVTTEKLFLACSFNNKIDNNYSLTYSSDTNQQLENRDVQLCVCMRVRERERVCELYGVSADISLNYRI